MWRSNIKIYLHPMSTTAQPQCLSQMGFTTVDSRVGPQILNISRHNRGCGEWQLQKKTVCITAIFCFMPEYLNKTIRFSSSFNHLSVILIVCLVVQNLFKICLWKDIHIYSHSKSSDSSIYFPSKKSLTSKATPPPLPQGQGNIIKAYGKLNTNVGGCTNGWMK